MCLTSHIAFLPVWYLLIFFIGVWFCCCCCCWHLHWLTGDCWGRLGEIEGSDGVARLCVWMWGREGYSEMCNALSNQVVFCWNVSCTALWASHVSHHRRIRCIRNAVIIIIIFLTSRWEMLDMWKRCVHAHYFPQSPFGHRNETNR